MNELPKILRLRAERIAQVHFDNVFATDNPNIVQGLLPDGSYVVVDLIKRIVIDKPPAEYHKELGKKEDAGIIADHSGKFTDAVTRESVEPTQPIRTAKKKVTKKTTARKSSRK